MTQPSGSRKKDWVYDVVLIEDDMRSALAGRDDKKDQNSKSLLLSYRFAVVKRKGPVCDVGLAWHPDDPRGMFDVGAKSDIKKGGYWQRFKPRGRLAKALGFNKDIHKKSAVILCAGPKVALYKKSFITPIPDSRDDLEIAEGDPKWQRRQLVPLRIERLFDVEEWYRNTLEEPKEKLDFTTLWKKKGVAEGALACDCTAHRVDQVLTKPSSCHPYLASKIYLGLTFSVTVDGGEPFDIALPALDSIGCLTKLDPPILAAAHCVDKFQMLPYHAIPANSFKCQMKIGTEELAAKIEDKIFDPEQNLKGVRLVVLGDYCTTEKGATAIVTSTTTKEHTVKIEYSVRQDLLKHVLPFAPPQQTTNSLYAGHRFKY